MCDVRSSIQCRHKLGNEANKRRQKQRDTMELFHQPDLAFRAHIHADIQEKTNRLKIYAKQVGLNISKEKKPEVMTLFKTPGQFHAMKLSCHTQRDSHIYSGSKVATDGGAGSDIVNRIVPPLNEPTSQATVERYEAVERSGLQAADT
ncbi:hypothetical protein ElyMa_006203200 [Elysia marginata]|uniref:Uncharacterized protein n=1 Tax=Elysia marginata TaxID=1093978 RepID=A0AAV4H702_9GAST|nr:hypothetical protein ElyMa_006203200 [Elysia marginata]